MDALSTSALIGLGIGGAIVIVIFAIVMGILCLVGEIILLCKSIKAKDELKTSKVDENIINKISTYSIWTLVITILSCSGCVMMVFPILALVFTKSNARAALLANNIEEANKKADLALLMLIIGNAIMIGITILTSTLSIVQNALTID